MKTHNPFKNIFTDCPPESPWQLYLNAALVAVGKAHGAFLNDLSEEVSQLVINAVVTAAYAALEAAHVADEWSAVAKPAKVRSLWDETVIKNPVDIYAALAWQYQKDHHPQLLDERFSEVYLAELIAAIDEMLKFALTAAGVADSWDRIYEQTLAKVQR